MSLEEGGRALNAFIESLKAQPLSLALVAMNCALLAFLFWSARETQTARTKFLLENQQILASCIHVGQLETLMKATRDRDK